MKMILAISLFVFILMNSYASIPGSYAFTYVEDQERIAALFLDSHKELVNEECLKDFLRSDDMIRAFARGFIIKKVQIGRSYSENSRKRFVVGTTYLLGETSAPFGPDFSCEMNEI